MTDPCLLAGSLSILVGDAALVEPALSAVRDRVLLAVRFGATGAPPLASPWVEVANPVLGSPPVLEVWLSDSPTARFERSRLAWAEGGGALFGTLSRDLEDDVEAATREQFTELLDLVEERNHPHLLRIWNFLPAINAELDGLERYRQFNAGRAAAFVERYGESGAEGRFSASSAVGAPSGKLVTYFAAARPPGRHLGNPRQLNAYRYPSEHGRRAPSFSRATIAPAELGELLFLSGTASIAGHQSLHAGSLAGQLEETVTNIHALLRGASREGRAEARLDEFELLRVYVRHRESFPAVRDALARRVGRATRVLFVEADICRAELLLEIEGVGRFDRSRPGFVRSLSR